MSNLLQIAKFQSKALTKGKKPLMVEIPVDPKTAPYLVSSSKGMLWIEQPHPNDVVLAAVRNDIIPGLLFLDVVKSVVSMSLEKDWGSILPFSEEGLIKGLDYLKSFDFSDLDVLYSSSLKEGPLWLENKNLKKYPVMWLPDEYIVIVPKDRSYLGVLWHLDSKNMVTVVHNASRAMVVLKG